jgi:hypothetical protein
MVALNFPTSPSNGDTFENYIYDGTKAVWRLQPNVPSISSKFNVSATAPATPTSGEIWLNSTDGKTYIYYVDGDSSQWIEIGGTSAVAPTVTSIDDIGDVTITSAAEGQTLVYNGSAWINGDGGAGLEDHFLFMGA